MKRVERWTEEDFKKARETIREKGKITKKAIEIKTKHTYVRITNKTKGKKCLKK